MSALGIRFVLVPHGAKVEQLGDFPPEIGANPPMTIAGMADMLPIADEIAQYGPFQTCWTSFLARAMCAASVVCLRLGIENMQVRRGLGQHSNLDRRGDQKVVVAYPGREHEDMGVWQTAALRELDGISLGLRKGETGLIVTHRPIIAGIVASCYGITDPEKVRETAHNPELIKHGYVVVEGGRGRSGRELALVFPNDLVLIDTD